MTGPSPLLIKPTRRHEVVSAPTAERPRLDTVDWLLALDDTRFAHYVSQEVRRAVNSRVRAGLRDPQVLGRWAAALRSVLAKVEWDLSDADRADMPHYAYWRRKTCAFRGYAMARLNEAEALLAETGGAA